MMSGNKKLFVDKAVEMYTIIFIAKSQSGKSTGFCYIGIVSCLKIDILGIG